MDVAHGDIEYPLIDFEKFNALSFNVVFSIGQIGKAWVRVFNTCEHGQFNEFGSPRVHLPIRKLMRERVGEDYPTDSHLY